MNHVTSKDGTSIAYEREGRGPAVVLVGGAIDDGTENAPLVPELAGSFTTYNLGRRHLQRVFGAYTEHYNRPRQHRSL